jgi:predicted dehydrogenase
MGDERFNWGIIGPGGIARAFAGGLAHSRTGRLVAIGARNPEKPEYGEHFPGARILPGYDALLADPDIDAVYIATPHPQHAHWGIAAARAGKHALVEKPLGMNAAEASAMFDAARQAGTFMGEAFMYRLHPMTAKICQLLKDGAVGDVRMIKSSFGFAMPEFDPDHRMYSPALGGGGILDVGCYPVSMARLIAGAVRGADFADPIKVRGTGHLGRTGVDEWASALLTFEDGLIAEVSCSVSVQQDNFLRVFGSTGRLEVVDFWFATGHEGGSATIRIIANDGAEEAIDVHEDRWLYSFEADGVADAIAKGRHEFAAPGMSWADTLGNMKVLDLWRRDLGLSYPVECETAERLGI